MKFFRCFLIFTFIAVFFVNIYSFQTMYIDQWFDIYSKQTVYGYHKSGMNKILYNPLTPYSGKFTHKINGFNYSPFMFSQNYYHYIPFDISNLSNIDINYDKLEINYTISSENLVNVYGYAANETGEPLGTLFLDSASSAYNKHPNASGGVLFSYTGATILYSFNFDDLNHSSLHRLPRYSYDFFQFEGNNSPNESENILFSYNSNYVDVLMFRKMHLGWAVFPNNFYNKTFREDYFGGIRGKYEGINLEASYHSNTILAQQRYTPAAFVIDYSQLGVSAGYDFEAQIKGVDYTFKPTVGVEFNKAGPSNKNSINKSNSIFRGDIEEIAKVNYPENIIDDLEDIENISLVLEPTVIKEDYEACMRFLIRHGEVHNFSASIKTGFFRYNASEGYPSFAQEFIEENSLIERMYLEGREFDSVYAINNWHKNFGYSQYQSAGVVKDFNVDYGFLNTINANLYYFFGETRPRVNDTVFQKDLFYNTIKKRQFRGIYADGYFDLDDFFGDSMGVKVALFKDFLSERQNNYPLLKLSLQNSYSLTDNLSFLFHISWNSNYNFIEFPLDNTGYGNKFSMDFIITQYFFSNKLKMSYEFYQVNLQTWKDYPYGADVNRAFNYRLTYKI